MIGAIIAAGGQLITTVIGMISSAAAAKQEDQEKILERLRSSMEELRQAMRHIDANLALNDAAADARLKAAKDDAG